MDPNSPRSTRWIFRAGNPLVVGLVVLAIATIVVAVVLVGNDWVTWVIAATVIVATVPAVGCPVPSNTMIGTDEKREKIRRALNLATCVAPGLGILIAIVFGVHFGWTNPLTLATPVVAVIIILGRTTGNHRFGPQ